MTDGDIHESMIADGYLPVGAERERGVAGAEGLLPVVLERPRRCQVHGHRGVEGQRWPGGALVARGGLEQREGLRGGPQEAGGLHRAAGPQNKRVRGKAATPRATPHQLSLEPLSATPCSTHAP